MFEVAGDQHIIADAIRLSRVGEMTEPINDPTSDEDPINQDDLDDRDDERIGGEPGCSQVAGETSWGLLFVLVGFLISRRRTRTRQALY